MRRNVFAAPFFVIWENLSTFFLSENGLLYRNIDVFMICGHFFLKVQDLTKNLSIGFGGYFGGLDGRKGRFWV